MPDVEGRTLPGAEKYYCFKGHPSAMQLITKPQNKWSWMGEYLMMAFPGCTILSYPGEDKRCIHHMLATMYEGPKYIEVLNNATKDLIITTT